MRALVLLRQHRFLTMPVTRSNKTSTRAGKSYSRSTSNPSKKSFGPISAQDIEIAAFSGVCDARKFNESRITAALHDLVPCPPKQAWIKATDNMRVSRPKLSTGKTGGALGRWLQVVSICVYPFPTFSDQGFSALRKKAKFIRNPSLLS